MRSAEKQPEMVRLSAGMDQSNGTRGADPGTFEVVQNCRVNNGGLQKRCGSAAIASTADSSFRRAISDTTTSPRPVEHPAFVATLGDTPIAATSAGWAFSYSDGAVRFSAEFSAAQPVRKRLGLSAPSSTQPIGPYMPAVAVNGDGYVCTAAAFGTELVVMLESPSGERLISESETIGAAGVIVRIVVASSTSFLVCYQGSASTTVSYKPVNINSGYASVSAGGTLVTLANAASTWDISPYDGTTWFLVYQSGATACTVAEYSGTTSGSTVTFSTTDNQTYLSVWADPVTDRIWIGVTDDPTGTPVNRFLIYTDALSLSVGPSDFAATGTLGVPLFGPLYTRTPVAGDAFCAFRRQSSTVYWFTTVAVIQAGSLTRELAAVREVIPISKPDAQQRVWVASYNDSSNYQIARVALLRFVGAEFIGSASFDPTPVIELASPEFETPGDTYHVGAQPGRAFQAVSVTSESAGGRAFFAFPFVLTSRTNASSATEPSTRAEVYEYTRWNQEPHRQIAKSGRAGFVAGQPTEVWGLIKSHTGSMTEHGGVEIGFLQSPVITSSTVTPSGSGLAAGTYTWFALQEWVDDDGNRHLSAPSAPWSLTLAAQSEVQLSWTQADAGQRTDIDKPSATQRPVTLLYRTQNGGTEAQLVPLTGTVTSSVNFTDTVADSIIDDNEFLYTAGGVLPNVLAPSCRYIAVSEERLWCGGLWDSNIIECSKIRVPGEPYNFTGHPSHQVVIPGEVTGIAYMDGQLCVFTEDAVYLVSGDGPNDQGAGGFAPPRALVRGVGCPREQSASILETEIGILFRSKMGFYLIPRGYGSPEYIGSKVQNEDTLVLSAATSTTSEYRLAHFLVCASGETKSDTVLTLDLTDGHWYRDTYTVDGDSITGQGFSEIGEWPDGLALFSYGLQRTDNLNVIWAHDEDLTGDAGAAGVGETTYVAQRIVTNWIQLMGPLGLMRLAEVVVKAEPVGSSSAVTALVETDANSNQSLSWTLTTSEEVSYRNVAVSEPTCTEFRVTLSDAAGAANSAGVRFLALGFATMPIAGIRRGTDSEGG